MKALIREIDKPFIKNPIAIITMNTEPSIVDYWIEKLVTNPGKYTVEVEFKFVFSNECSLVFHNVFGSLLLAYEKQTGKLKPEQIMAALFGVLQGFAYTEELDKKEEENEQY